MALSCLGIPALAIVAALLLAPRHPGPVVDALLAMALVTPMAPLIYRVAFQRLAEASVLVLLIAAVGVHLAMGGLGLLVFGAEGARGEAFGDARFTLGPLNVNLLGLLVDLKKVHLTITANATGGVLGSLFCGLANTQV